MIHCHPSKVLHCNGEIGPKLRFGHCWLGGPIDLKPTRFNCIFQDIFRHTPLYHIWRAQIRAPNTIFGIIDPGRRNPWWRGGGRCCHFLSRSLILNFSWAVVWPATVSGCQASAGWIGRGRDERKWKFYHDNCLSCWVFYCQCLFKTKAFKCNWDLELGWTYLGIFGIFRLDYLLFAVISLNRLSLGATVWLKKIKDYVELFKANKKLLCC